MPQGWLPTAPDQRTFALLQQRILEDINRPEMQSIVQQYAQDAIRYYQRKPFFFNDTDNTAVPGWAAGTYFTQGATLLVSDPAPTGAVTFWVANTAYAVGDRVIDANGNGQLAQVAGISGASQPVWANAAFEQTQDNTVIWIQTNVASTSQLVVVNLVAGITGATEPIWPQNLYTVPSNLTSPPTFTPPTLGTVADGAALWATVAQWAGPGIYTQLSTVPSQNQYVPPIDLVAPKRIEVTWSANLRIGMTKLTYDELRDYDVIRPTPPTTYPSYWAWYQQQLYFWPYPVGFYPITLSYRTAPPVPRNASDSNFWTQTAEALIRHYASGRILENVVRDAEGAQEAYDLANRELAALIGMRIQQDTGTEGSGIPPAPW